MTLFTPQRYPDEFKTVTDLAAMLPWDAARKVRVQQGAAELLQIAGSTSRKMGEIESFLKQYALDTNEGIALVCLAEALLRIPDAATGNALIRDKVTAVNWLQGKMESSDWLVRAARYGLSFTKSTLDSFLSKLGEPVIRQGMIQGIRMLGRQFVLGQTIDEAVANAREEMGRGYALSFDMLGEGARTAAMAERYYNAYRDAITSLGAARAKGSIDNPRTGISVKLSALHPRYNPLQESKCRPVLTDRLLQLCQMAAQHNLTLTVDAEETERLELSLQIIGDVAAHPSIKEWQGFGLAVQAYQKYAPELVDYVAQMARQTGRRLRVRLVKGAYWDTEAKRAQILGLPDYQLFTRKANTDLCYLVCAHKMLQYRSEIYPMFATHNAHTLAAILEMAGADKNDFEFQRLQGMGAPLHDAVLNKHGANVTIYAPVGTHEDLLAYLVRRLLENGANTSFLNKLNKDAAAAELVADPVDAAVQHTTRRHARLPNPADIYGASRKNSRGFDLSHADERGQIVRNVLLPTINLRDTQPAEIDVAVKRAHAAFPAWSGTDVNARADALNKFADLLEQETPALMRLCTLEGYKTVGDALAEVREAVDFARYYAAQARGSFSADGMLLPGPTGESNRLLLRGRGVFACISPWNFPLAIFAGQVCAALVAGNTVVAKAAEQTPKIAAFAISLLHRAGVPDDALINIVGDGGVGAALVAHPDIAGVAFTGSFAAARAINQTLAAKLGAIVPLIAETGGQNAMIVDSTALLEQVCDDVMMSAFGSAGQRCSALRVLYVQDDVADKLLELIGGAMAELRVGDPADPSTDIGPVIDRDAFDRLVEHERYLGTIGAKRIARADIDVTTVPDMYFFAPVAYEISSIDQLPGEVFGPVLHIIRYPTAQLSRVIDDINHTGFGLTFGLHTRIDARMDEISSQIEAGNLYINRTMIGAVVGVQPFGGQGLSGTGPKAGGPHYLLRFAHEKVITRNTAASGGNIALVAGSD